MKPWKRAKSSGEGMRESVIRGSGGSFFFVVGALAAASAAAAATTPSRSDDLSISAAKIDEHQVIMPRSQTNVVSDATSCASLVCMTTMTNSPERCLPSNIVSVCPVVSVD